MAFDLQVGVGAGWIEMVGTNGWGVAVDEVMRWLEFSKTRWWFQIFFIFTPKIGEDSQFD